MDVLAGSDFFTAEVLTWSGLVTYYVLFFIELESRRVFAKVHRLSTGGHRPRMGTADCLLFFARTSMGAYVSAV
jgi:hypothetical protein